MFYVQARLKRNQPTPPNGTALVTTSLYATKDEAVKAAKAIESTHDVRVGRQL